MFPRGCEKGCLYSTSFSSAREMALLPANKDLICTGKKEFNVLLNQQVGPGLSVSRDRCESVDWAGVLSAAKGETSQSWAESEVMGGEGLHSETEDGSLQGSPSHC